MTARREKRVWQLQDAKNRFSEVVDEARSNGPQIVTRRGREAVVVIGIDEYRELTGQKKPKRSFTRFLMAAPKIPGGLRIETRTDSGREVEL